MSAPHAEPKYIRVNRWNEMEPSKQVGSLVWHASPRLGSRAVGGPLQPRRPPISLCKLEAYGRDKSGICKMRLRAQIR